MLKIKFILFSLIGVFNTFFDIALYVALRYEGQSVLVANLISASAALIISYLLNSRLTFKSKTWTLNQFVAFVVVTLFGLWVLQTSCIYVLDHFLYVVSPAVWHLFGEFERLAKTTLPKICSTAITLVWNYTWYSKVIFKRSNQTQNQLVLTTHS